MAKKTDLNDQVKIRGIRKRWLLNSVGVVLLILVLALGSFFATLWSYYYASTANDLIRPGQLHGLQLPQLHPDPVLGRGPAHGQRL